MARLILFISFVSLLSGSHAQSCCSGGSGNPIAGGSLMGVLQEKQMEVSLSHQYMSSTRFKAEDRDTTSLIDRLYSNYTYARVSYGISKQLTMSLESGYFLNRTEIALHARDTISNSGFGDLIIFPRYNVLNKTNGSKKTEMSLGLGYKIPIGHYNDSFVVYQNPYTLQNYYVTSPPTVQPTTGSQDFIFYAFIFRANTCKQFRVFSNMVYIKKGWNPLGQKFGDMASIGIFASKTFFGHLALTLQLRGDWTGKMQYDKNLDMLALYNIDVNSTGSRKLFVAPQVSYTNKNFTLFALYEYPLYQYLNRVQIASQYQFTGGISYRFSLAKAQE